MRLFIAGLAVCGTFGILAAADWPQFLGPNRDNASTEPGVATTFPAGGPKELWKMDVGPGFGGAAIEGGMVYIMDRDGSTASSPSSGEKADIVRCVDLATGKEQWNFSYDAAMDPKYILGSRSTPLVDKDNVYTLGPLGDLYCVSKKTHKPLWCKQLAKDFGAAERPYWYYAQSPAAYKDMIIVAPFAKDVGVVALKRDTGEVVWKSPALGENHSYTSPLVTTIDGVDQVVVMPKRATGIDAATGKVLWTCYKWSAYMPIPSPLYLGEGRIFLCGPYNAGCALIKVAKGEGKWSAEEVFSHHNFGSWNANPVFYKGYLYANGTTEKDKNGMQCMDLKGEIKWQTAQLDPPVDFGAGNVLLADGVIFLLNSGTGELAVVRPSPEGYKELSRAKVLDAKGGNVFAPLAISDGKLIVRDLHQMKCLDVKAAGK
jgi:outer membrane protein assembly factor BamB